MPRPFTIVYDTDHEHNGDEARINIYTSKGTPSTTCETGFLTYPELLIYIAELRTLYDDHFSGE